MSTFVFESTFIKTFATDLFVEGARLMSLIASHLMHPHQMDSRMGWRLQSSCPLYLFFRGRLYRWIILQQIFLLAICVVVGSGTVPSFISLRWFGANHVLCFNCHCMPSAHMIKSVFITMVSLFWMCLWTFHWALVEWSSISACANWLLDLIGKIAHYE